MCLVGPSGTISLTLRQPPLPSSLRLSQSPSNNARISKFFPHFTNRRIHYELIHYTRFTARHAAERTAPPLWCIRNRADRAFCTREFCAFVANRNSARPTGGAPDKPIKARRLPSRSARNPWRARVSRQSTAICAAASLGVDRLTPSLQRGGR